MTRLLLAGALLALLAACGGWPGTVDAPERDDAGLRVVVISDINGPYGTTEYGPEVHLVIREITERWRPDLVLSSGDLIAGQRATLEDATVREMWAAFDSAVARPLREAGIPFLPVMGNHDGSAYPAFERDRRLARDYWGSADERLPELRVIDRDFPFWYAVEHRGLFVLVWNATNEETAADTAGLRWASEALHTPAARAAGVRIAAGHLPLRSVAEGRDRRGEVLAEPDELLAFLGEHGVDAYVSGHHHAYYPGHAGGVDLFHVGALGSGPRPLLGSEEPPVRTVTLLDIDPATGAIRETTYRVDASAGPALRRIEPDELPPHIDGVNGRVVRRDLAGDA